MDRTKTFVLLLAQHQRGLYAFILSLLPNWADADDVFQETTLRLWEQFDKFEVQTDFAAWSRAVARFQVMTRRKRSARDRARFSDAFLDALERVPTDDADDLGRQEALSRCLGRLPARDRAVLSAYYAPGAAAADVAAQLGRTAGSLRVTVCRLRRALRTCVQRHLHLDLAVPR